ncbi:hypothetical protein PISL3812_02973 [Talaromyces islandicus]|uniref:Uncharacterized protein n=1 Tax=Talaromyces islandicus TaxID=28573 RepID=A0A0U1LTP7_TALIS|nr:hypothetical protein PISL3812_02973 [Talaromyces islandicus]
MLHLTLYQSYPHLNYENPLATRLPPKHRLSKSQLSLATILQNYLTTIDQPIPENAVRSANRSSDAAIRRVFNAASLRYLSAKGYSPEDVMAWAWILGAEQTYRAALRLFFWDSHPGHEPTPLFVLKLLLRRTTLDVKAFRVLLSYSRLRINQLPLGTMASAIQPGAVNMDRTSTQVLQGNPLDIARVKSLVTILLRKARELWPAALIYITRSFAHYLTHQLDSSHTTEAGKGGIDSLRASHFNACLCDLAITPRHGPFASASIQEEAQFELLKAMAAHDPVLPVNRRGYQALIAVQLCHPKTPAERVYTTQKSPSWPPWKEARLGMDTERGDEGMKSRAMQVMAQMTEAGYSRSTYEEIASILAGWDTDGSPTIQTRSLMPSTASQATRWNRSKIDSIIWSARIRATRTLREAWACFLSYQNIYPVPTQRVYQAMAEKLIYSGVIKENEPNNPYSLLPGDGFEVFPEPSSARDVLYVPTEPPSLDQLLRQMISQGVRPSESFVSLLLRTCPDPSTGLKYACDFLSRKQIKALCTVHHSQATTKTLNSMQNRLVDSFIACLCSPLPSDASRYRLSRADAFPVLMRTPLSSTGSVLVSQEQTPDEFTRFSQPRALSHAVKLLRSLKPARVSAWLPLLKALGSYRACVGERHIKRDRQWFLAWYEIIEVLQWMTETEVEAGMDGLRTLCHVFAGAVSAGIRDVNAAEEGLLLVQKAKDGNGLSYDAAATFEVFVLDGLRYLKAYFDRLVHPLPVFPAHSAANANEVAALIDKPLPGIFQVPGPDTLHAFVRALGAAEDSDGILNLLQWMSRSPTELGKRANQSLSGHRMTRRTLTAIRVFLESGGNEDLHHIGQSSACSSSDEGSDTEPTFSDAHVEEAYKLITATQGLAPWPSDEEVSEYLLWRTGPGDR